MHPCVNISASSCVSNVEGPQEMVTLVNHSSLLALATVGSKGGGTPSKSDGQLQHFP